MQNLALRLLITVFVGLLSMGALQPASAQGRLDPGLLDFGDVLVGDSAIDDFEYEADSSSIIAVHFTPDNSVFTVSPSAVTSPPVGDPFGVMVTFRPRTVGLFTGNIIVEADVLMGNSTVRVPVGMVELREVH